jgi:hypothetical protein
MKMRLRCARRVSQSCGNCASEGYGSATILRYLSQARFRANNGAPSIHRAANPLGKAERMPCAMKHDVNHIAYPRVEPLFQQLI